MEMSTMTTATKPRVYWRPEDREDFDPAESCWAVQDGNASIGFESWPAAFRYAYLTSAMAVAS